MKIFDKSIKLEGATFTLKNKKVYLVAEGKNYYVFPGIMNACAFLEYCQGREGEIAGKLISIEAPGTFDLDFELNYFIMLLEGWLTQESKDEWTLLKESGFRYIME